MNVKHSLWVEKYRPQNLQQYIFQDPVQKQRIQQMVKDKTIPHLLLSGVQGSGKTCLSNILITAMDIDDSDVLTINASDENSVDTFRDKIKNFVSTISLSAFKIVQLEEADYISLNGQAVMRSLMEQYADNARFILTCNYPHKIMPAIRSRCQEFRFKACDKNDIAEQCFTILSQENVKCTLDVIDKYIALDYPDIRKIINSMQENSINGTLTPPTGAGGGSDWKHGLLDFIERNDWNGARKLTCGTVISEEWEDVYRFLYENLDKSTKFSKDRSSWEQAILIVAQHLYQHSIVADPEINAAAMYISLGQI